VFEFPHAMKPRPIGADGFFPLKGKITASVLQRIYNIPDGTLATNPNTTVAAGEFQGDDAFSYEDMAEFVVKAGLPTTSNITRIIDATGNWINNGGDGESTMDLELLLGVAQGAQVWYFSNPDWMYDFTQYYQTVSNPPLITSISWGWMEADQCSLDSSVCSANGYGNAEYVNRTNVEFMKLGTMGFSIIVCSQDEGAPSDNNIDCSNTDHPVWPVYPASSPYVTAVGATALLDPSKQAKTKDDSPICSKITCSAGTVESTAMPSNAAFTSGGGFSDLMARPSYQDAAVTAWINGTGCRPDQQYWASANRAYPDISAVGENIFMIEQGSITYNGGTSASTPIVSGIMALLNDYRLNNGKAPLGFLNPILYDMAVKTPTAFNDITLGVNNCTAFGVGSSCCAGAGYCAVAGWDPATGLGTPNYSEMLTYIKTLP